MIVIEAMMYGLPVVGSNLGGIPELLKEGRGLYSILMRTALYPKRYNRQFIFRRNNTNSCLQTQKILYKAFHSGNTIKICAH